MAEAVPLFLRQFVRTPRSVGAVLPSSSALAAAMLAPIDFAQAQTIVEFGPGTGAITRHISQRLRPGSRYLGIELSASFCRSLRVAYPRLEFVQGNVTDLPRILASHGIEQIDAIVSGLPWASLPLSLQERVFTEVEHALAPNGLFITFAYLHGLMLPGARALRRRLRRGFAQFRRSRPVWANVPPALAYVCRKGPAG